MNKKKFYFEGEETNYSVSSDGRVFNDKTGKELKGTIKRNEYRSVQFTINGKPKSFMVHRLVAELFCENPNNYTIVDHIDRDKMNNCADNLRWVDNKTNAINIDGKKESRKKYLYQETEDVIKKPIKINENYLATSNGFIINQKTKRVIYGSLRNGYRRINIDGTYYSNHRLIWEAFNGPIPDGYIIDHIDEDREHNSLDNLRMVTQSENMMNKIKNRTHSAQIKIKQYTKDGTFIQEFPSIRAAARAVDVTEAAVRTAANRKGTSAGYVWIKEEK